MVSKNVDIPLALAQRLQDLSGWGMYESEAARVFCGLFFLWLTPEHEAMLTRIMREAQATLSKEDLQGPPEETMRKQYLISVEEEAQFDRLSPLWNLHDYEIMLFILLLFLTPLPSISEEHLALFARQMLITTRKGKKPTPVRKRPPRTKQG